MLTLGSLAFAAPVALAALALLPGLWWLLRATPPTPMRVAFPPLRLLASLRTTEESTAQTPIWLLALRLLVALALILAAAHPLIKTGPDPTGSGPLVLIVDDGWAAARDWPTRQTAMKSLTDVAERLDRSVVLMTTAPTTAGDPRSSIRLLNAGAAQTAVEVLQPKPWPTDRAAALTALEAFLRADGLTGAEILWLSDGLEEPEGLKTLGALAGSLGGLGSVTVVAPEPDEAVMMLKSLDTSGASLKVSTVRSTSSGDDAASLRALSEDGALLAKGEFRFANGERRTEAKLELPLELLNRVVRVEIEGEITAGAATLLDESRRRRSVGLLTEEGATADQPLLGSLYYLERAIEPFAEVRRGDIAALLERDLAALVLADVGRLDPSSVGALGRWIEDGGVLLRFAGPRLAAESGSPDPLLPVKLYGGDRAIGGALSWRRPAKLAPFDEESPFFGLSVPAEVEVHRQVLAEPTVEGSGRTWARLEDGTPLVTAVRRGQGWSMLVHTAANPEWSSLPLSGLFVDLLRRVVGLSQGASPTPGGPPLSPLQTLDGFGRLSPPPPQARAIDRGAFAETKAEPSHPPGFYGDRRERFALNLAAGLADPRPLGPLPPGVARVGYGLVPERDLRPWLFGAALLLALVDLAVSLVLRGLLRPIRSIVRPAALVLGLAVALTGGTGAVARAQAVIADGSAEPAALVPRLAYVATADPEIDSISRAGLAGLSAVVNQRTAAELGAPVAVNPDRDELAFYPMLYWPLTTGTAIPSSPAAQRLKAYMRNGGTIVFDARGRGADPAALRPLAQALDIPPLIPVPEEHVLRRAFYLLSDFPGRWTGGTVWIERDEAGINDGVTTVIAGSNDWAGAWAADDALRPVLAVAPGGEPQREMAYRFGINLVMHVLTGNYKADQVHLPAILERLTQ